MVKYKTPTLGSRKLSMKLLKMRKYQNYYRQRWLDFDVKCNKLKHNINDILN